MVKKISVMTLHGIGNIGTYEPNDSTIPTYSKNLHRAVRKKLGSREFDDKIAWREVSYFHITQKNQDIYFNKVKCHLRYNWKKWLGLSEQFG